MVSNTDAPKACEPQSKYRSRRSNRSTHARPRLFASSALSIYMERDLLIEFKTVFVVSFHATISSSVLEALART